MSTAAPASQDAFVLEVFESRQGEGICIGDPMIFIRFGGCNLVCDYCDTPESIPAKSGRKIELNGVLAQVDALRGNGPALPVSITGGEPLLHVEFLKALLPALKARGHRIYLETNGTLPQALAAVLDECDWVSMDIKPPSAVKRDLWEAQQWFLETGAKKIFLKMVLTAATTDAEVMRAVALISGAKLNVPLVLQPVTPVGAVMGVPMERVMAWWAQAAKTLPDVRVLPQVHPLWQIP